MIRLPATSISLSEKDVEFHLRQADIYHGLLTQGFKKKDIIRYYADHKEQQHAESPFQMYTNTPSCVEMTVSRHNAVDTSPREPDLCPLAASPIVESAPQTSPSGARPSSTRHAPRQSSLLRFAKAVSPESASSESAVALDPEFLSSPRTQAKSYRPRSHTEPYDESEADDVDEMDLKDAEVEDDLSRLTLASSPPNTTGRERTTLQYGTGILFSPGIRTKSPISSPLRPDAAEFIPHNLPPPFSATRRASSNQASLPSGSRNTTPFGPNYEIHSRSNTSLPLSTPPRSSSLSNLSSHLNTSPRTPDAVSSQSVFQSPSESSVSLPPQITSTPAPMRRDTVPRTEPRSSQYHSLDGTTFSIYNDGLPAEIQPQTPADLARRRILTEQDAAYTAPPGRVYSNSFGSRYRSQMSTIPEPGEQSPTVRAMGIRGRRNRELTRAARAEGQRWARERGEGLARERVGNDWEGFMGPVGGWRSDLDVDRAGDENYENSEETERSIRVVGGRDIMDMPNRRN